MRTVTQYVTHRHVDVPVATDWQQQQSTRHSILPHKFQQRHLEVVAEMSLLEIKTEKETKAL
jgi:hypothetical protein